MNPGRHGFLSGLKRGRINGQRRVLRHFSDIVGSKTLGRIDGCVGS